MTSAQAVRESDGIHYTNRCGNARNPGCGRALTKLEILDAMGPSPGRKSICPCGSNAFRSSNFKWWEELLLPRSWRLWWAIRNGQVVPPPSRAFTLALEAALMDSAVQRSMADEEMPGEDR